MAKIRRLNPYHPQVKLYAYEVRVKNKGRLSIVAQGHTFGLSIQQVKDSINKRYDLRYYTAKVRMIDKAQNYSYKFKEGVDNKTSLYL